MFDPQSSVKLARWKHDNGCVPTASEEGVSLLHKSTGYFVVLWITLVKNHLLLLLKQFFTVYNRCAFSNWYLDDMIVDECEINFCNIGFALLGPIDRCLYCYQRSLYSSTSWLQVIRLQLVWSWNPDSDFGENVSQFG